jgi:GT2 family glycosyltransferase
MLPRVAVVILNYNNWQDTLACVESVLAGSVAPAWTIIVDNASANDSIRWFRHWAAGNLEFVLPEFGVAAGAPKPLPLLDLREGVIPPAPEDGAVALVRRAKNGGYAAGNNAGIVPALAWGADAVWILNNDTVVCEDALQAMRDRLFSKSRPGLCGSLVRYMEGDGLVQCRGGGFTNKWTGLSTLHGNRLPVAEALRTSTDTVERDLNFIYGASVMVSRAFIEAAGLMDERYFLYCEEQDWAYSAKGEFDFAYAPGAIVRHKEGGSTGFSHNRFNARVLFRLLRSRLLLTWKHFPGTLPTVALSIVYAAARMAWRRVFHTAH